MIRKNASGQTGVELLMSYGWVILLGAGAVVLLYQMNSYTPVQCHKSTVGFSQVVPVDWAVYLDNNLVVLNVENWAGDPVILSGVLINSGDLVCSGEYSEEIQPGKMKAIVVECPEPGLRDKFRLGDCFIMDVAFGYANVRSSNEYESRGKIYGPVELGNAPSTTSTTSPSSTSSSTSSTSTTSTSSTSSSTTSTTTSSSTSSSSTTTSTSSTTTINHLLVELIEPADGAVLNG